jgi:hypothetical protein
MIEANDRVGPRKKDSKEYFEITFLHQKEDAKSINVCISQWERAE